MTENFIIPEDIRRFVLEHIDSVAQVETLLLLRAESKSEVSAEAIARRLYIGEKEAAYLLVQLSGIGLLATSENKPPLYKYQPQSPELETLADRLADVYAHYLLPVTHLIHSKSKSRIQEFADAFQIKKE